ncbi:hypothetical protein [Paenibacillus thermotolerans]|uniref:hypothetical protein n=1 Tax=Paenibacillus thermotolerans TaxID=3027807 RepID=UPI0023678020|nr:MULTISPECIES: hypothetical protein [unclassified Paenibacillus]
MELNYYVIEKLAAEHSAKMSRAANRWALRQGPAESEGRSRPKRLFTVTLWNLEFSVAAVRK